MQIRDGEFGVERWGRGTVLVRVLAVTSAVYLTGGFGWALLTPGFTLTRLALATLAVGVAWAGVVGTFVERPVIPLVSALALFLLGFWQAVLWIFMLPTALGLAITAVVVAHTR